MDEWRDCKQHVLHTIDELQRDQKELSDQITTLKIEAAVLKTKIITWGSIASVIGAMIGSLIVGLAMKYLGFA